MRTRHNNLFANYFIFLWIILICFNNIRKFFYSIHFKQLLFKEVFKLTLMRSVEMIVVCNEVVDLLSAEIQNSNYFKHLL